MKTQIKTINGGSIAGNLGKVNCYLVRTDAGDILIDTGFHKHRSDLENDLVSNGCIPGTLKLIILTHGDFDHIGNAAYLRDKYRVKIAMHPEDSGMIERGDMFWNRKKGSLFIRAITKLLFKFAKSDRAKPDIYLDEALELKEYGLDAQVISIPGHSIGSIGILTANGELFCGDLFENVHKPSPNSIIDDHEAYAASIEKLRQYDIVTVYPGHGTPFQWSSFSSE